MKTLHLTLKKKWFDMTESGEKPEEYREIKEYWVRRLVDFNEALDLAESASERKYEKFAIPHDIEFDINVNNYSPEDTLKAYRSKVNDFDAVQATNGYGKKVPSWKRECLGIEIREGRPEWGAEPGKKYFVIKLGKIIPILLLTLFLFSCVSSKPVPEPPKHVSPKLPNNDWK